MPQPSSPFRTPHNVAFKTLGALEPGQQWSAFDVLRPQVIAGKASLFVTTIWNFHSIKDPKGRRTPTTPAIIKDHIEGTYWYCFSMPTAGDTRKTWIAHWNGVNLAIDKKIPIVGVLKDVRSGLCSLTHVFDCANPRIQVDGSAIWLQIIPRSAVGCEIRLADIHQVISSSLTPPPLVKFINKFEESVNKSIGHSAIDRNQRLASASRFPKRIEVITTLYDRNPDVVAEVLLRAKGICEECAESAPFLRRSNGTPYLEVHHRIRLADGGEDTVSNAIAICPNCHRAAHYG